jgi:predicted nucleic acid-binding Zn ribbon protein
MDSRDLRSCASSELVDFRQLKDLLTSRTLPDLFKRRLQEAEGISRWEIAVGPTIAKYAHAVRVQDGVLHVEVAHPIWRSELHHRRRQILEILNQGTSSPSEIFLDLHFVDPKNRRKTANKTAPTAHQNQTGTPGSRTDKPDPGSGER